MLPLLSRGCLGALIVLQTLQPAVAWNWYVVEEPCCCEVEWDCCEADVEIASDECGCEAEPLTVDECGCGGEPAESETSEPAEQPEPAQSNKAPTLESQASQTETPQPALEADEELPPAPINVPTTPAAETEVDEIFPGPATETAAPAESEPAASTALPATPAEVVPSTTPAAEPAAQPSDNAGSLFDEPAAEAEPATPPATEPAASTETPAGDTESTESSVDDVFGEPSQPAEESADDTPVVEEETIEEESVETESTEEPASDPLDELFGPSSAVEQPELNLAAAAPLRAAGGLASGEFRQWSNRSSDFQCQGRLTRMTAEGVYVAQPNGELVAIAFSQLSDADLGFVRGQIQAQRALLAQEANSQVASH